MTKVGRAQSPEANAKGQLFPQYLPDSISSNVRIVGGRRIVENNPVGNHPNSSSLTHSGSSNYKSGSGSTNISYVHHFQPRIRDRKRNKPNPVTHILPDNVSSIETDHHKTMYRIQYPKYKIEYPPLTELPQLKELSKRIASSPLERISRVQNRWKVLPSATILPLNKNELSSVSHSDFTAFNNNNNNNKKSKKEMIEIRKERNEKEENVKLPIILENKKSEEQFNVDLYSDNLEKNTAAWFDRFKILAQHLYNLRNSKYHSGLIPKKHVRQIVHYFNKELNLLLSEKDIESAFRTGTLPMYSNSIGDHIIPINVDRFLRQLCNII
ncbi:hypothetical protein SNEBB_001249 [Seison nebaliae]|nr:hypothetical protein SNEBB_001249 [Seison nebaliae]